MQRALIAATSLAGLLLGVVSVGAQNGKAPTVKEVMKKLNYRDAAICPMIGKALKTEPVNWDEVQKEAKLFVTLAEALPKNDPPTGDRNSWNQLTKAYVASAVELDRAAQRQDKTAALTAHGKLANPATCNGCHKLHRN